MKLEIKMQTEALKALDKGQTVNYAEDEYHVFITLDGSSAVSIMKLDFFLDTKQMDLSKSLIGYFDPSKLADTHLLDISGDMKKVKNRILTALDYKGFRTYIDSEYLKKFCKPDCKLYAKDEKSPIYFVVHGDIYAIAMPVNTKR